MTLAAPPAPDTGLAAPKTETLRAPQRINTSYWTARSWSDYLFAALVLLAGVLVWQQFHLFMDGYEKREPPAEAPLYQMPGCNQPAILLTISCPALRPAPMARMTVAAPVTMSPPAKTLGMEVSPVFSSASM